MKKSLLIAILLVISLAILVYAFYHQNKSTSVINSLINSNSLAHGDYAVYAVINENTKVVDVYRYNLDSHNTIKIYSFNLLVGQEKPAFYKYESDKILIERAGSFGFSKLINLSGHEISDYYKYLDTYINFLFSPDNEMVAFNTTDPTDKNQNILKIHNLTNNTDTIIPAQSLLDSSNYLYIQKWSQDNSLVYVTQMCACEDYPPGLYAVDVVSKEVKEIDNTKELGLIQLSIDNNYNIYGIKYGDYNPFTFNGTHEIYQINKDTGVLSSYSLKETAISLLGKVNSQGIMMYYFCPVNENSSDLCIYDFQKKQELRLTSGQIVENNDVFWTNKGLVYIVQENANSSAIHFYDTEKGEDTLMAENKYFQSSGSKPADIYLIGCFNI